jgi:hypothetical protein
MDDPQADAWYSKGDEMGLEHIVVRVGDVLDGIQVELDIRDAVYFRYLLDGAINDYERAVGK